MKVFGKRRNEKGEEMRPSMITPQTGKRVCLRLRMGEVTDLLWMNNINGVTVGERGLDEGMEREMLQNRSAFDAMVNSLVMLFGMEIADVEYYNEEEGER